MGSCVSTTTNIADEYNAPQMKSCNYWEQDNTLTVCGYVRQIMSEYELYHYYKLPIDIKRLLISFYGEQYHIVGIGKNGDGEFGLGHNENIDTFISLHEFETICDSVGDIFCGMGRFIVKNVFNEIYSAGLNEYGAAAIDDYTPRIMSFNQITRDNADEYINIISSGLCPMHTIFVSINGNIYASGSNNEGQFGNGTRSISNYGLNLVGISETFNHEKICKVTTGNMHTLFLTTNGNVFSCGNNDVGQCGIPLINDDNDGLSQQYQLIPIKVAFLPSNICDIECGAYHNVILTDDHKIYVFGDRNLGNDTPNDMDHGKAILDPYMKDKKIISVSCGSYYTVCIDYNNQCWLYGNNTFGELGNGKREDDVKIPYLFQSMDEYKDILIDKAFAGVNHTLLLPTKNNINYKIAPLYSFGNNNYHQCSSKINDEVILKPYLLTKKEIGIGVTCNVERVIAGLDFTIIIFA